MGLKSLSSRFQYICLVIDMVGDLACKVVEFPGAGLGRPRTINSELNGAP